MRHNIFSVRSLPAVLSAGLLCLSGPALERVSFAQAPGVPIVRDGADERTARIESVQSLGRRGKLLTEKEVAKKLVNKTCELVLPKPSQKQLSERELWQRSREAHVRVGWSYLCPRCNNWHLNLAGGYFITGEGDVATCYHVVSPPEDVREGYLVVSTEDGQILPVKEIMAANSQSDAAIVRVNINGAKVRPLSLNTNVYPGDEAWCYSDPLGRSAYFSQGIVNRFYYHDHNKSKVARMEVSTAWAPGSSGAAVLDSFGNAIGHVSEISADGTRSRGTNATSHAEAPLMIFHSAIRAADVMALVKDPKKK